MTKDPRPFGVPLDELAIALEGSHLKTSREGNSLVVKHANYSTRVDVIRPSNRESPVGLIAAVVQIRTGLPQNLGRMLSDPTMISTMNTMATLGALTEDGGEVFVGSRLTILESDNAWNIHFPLLLLSILGSVDAMIGATRRSITQEDHNDSASDWQEQDLEQVEGYLSKNSFCNTDGLRLSAEFSLEQGSVSAIAGHRHTALWRLLADEPHPELGGGLFCVLEMPHCIGDGTRLTQLIAKLNQLEMTTFNLPPHFGAWCRSGDSKSPAYVSFLPNVLHTTNGIAANLSVWAYFRALHTNATLASMGVHV